MTLNVKIVYTTLSVKNMENVSIDRFIHPSKFENRKRIWKKIKEM